MSKKSKQKKQLDNVVNFDIMRRELFIRDRVASWGVSRSVVEEAIDFYNKNKTSDKNPINTDKNGMTPIDVMIDIWCTVNNMRKK